jgi:tetratricopeptide (TPR) repeat protein
MKREIIGVKRLGIGGLVLLAALVVAALAVARLGAAAPDPAAVIAEADKLNTAEKYEESNKLLMDLVKTNPNHPDIYWKIAENYYDLGELIPIAQKDKKLAMYKNCEQWAKKGYDKNPSLADNAFWMAVGLSQQAQTNGIAVTLISDRGLAKRIEDYYLKSSQAKEFHYVDVNSNTISSSFMALGVFYRKLPESSIVGLILGTRGDMDKSVDYNRKAVKMFPNSTEFNKELGVSLLCRGQRRSQNADLEEGKKILKKVPTLTPTSQLDKIDQDDSKKLLADPSLACGYSRVQQEVVSEKAFSK